MAFLLHLQSEAVLIEFRKKGLLYTYYCLLSGLFVKWEIKWITILASLVDPIGFGAQGLRTKFGVNLGWIILDQCFALFIFICMQGLQGSLSFINE